MQRPQRQPNLDPAGQGDDLAAVRAERGTGADPDVTGGDVAPAWMINKSARLLLITGILVPMKGRSLKFSLRYWARFCTAWSMPPLVELNRRLANFSRGAAGPVGVAA